MLNMLNKNVQTPTSTGHRSIPYCDQIIIAMLLVIIIAVPLYFDIHLHSVFDLSKITILYVLTFAILAVWSIKTIINCLSERHSQADQQIRTGPTFNGEGIDIQQHLRQPLILPILAFLFVSGFATVFSINPYLSLVGTYKRYGGFISTIVYISLFFIIVQFIDKKRLRSLINIIILTACFASIYGILQHFGLDLYRWSTSFGYGIRAAATFGHPAFFSAFLIMVIPLILIKIFSDPPKQDCHQPDMAALEGMEAGSSFRCSTFFYLGILTLLIVAFYYTKTRASFLGLLISNMFFFSLIGKKNLVANKTKAIDGAERIQKLYPRDYHSAFTLGQAYHILDKISPYRLSGGDEDMSKEAFKNYRIATTSHPFKFEFRNKLARLCAGKGQHEAAILELKEAKRIAPSNQAAYLNLAKVFMDDRERYEEAEAVLLEFIKKKPDNEIIDIYRLLSFIYVKTTKWEKVLIQSIEIIQIDREDLEAHKYAIMANFKLEKYDDARKLCNSILNLTGEVDNAYNKYAKEILALLSEM